MWVRSNFFDFDHNIVYYKTSEYRNYRIKDRDSFYTLIHLFFNLNFTKTIFAEKGNLLKSFDKKLWTAYDVPNTSKYFEHFLDDRGLIFVEDVWLIDNEQLNLFKNDFWLEDLKKQNLKNLFKKRGPSIKTLHSSKVRVLSNLAKSSKSGFGLFDNNNFYQSNFSSELVSVYKPYYRFLRNAFNFRLIYFIWTTLLVLSKSRSYLDRILLFLDSKKIGYLDRILLFLNLKKIDSNASIVRSFENLYLPSTLDLYKVCEYFYSVSTFDSEFYEDFRYIARLKKIRDFYGDSIFIDLMSEKDHKPSNISRIRLSSEINAPFQVIGNEGSETLTTILSSKELSLKIDKLISDKRPQSLDSINVPVFSELNVDATNTTELVVRSRIKRPGELLQHLVSLYSVYETPK